MNEKQPTDNFTFPEHNELARMTAKERRALAEKLRECIIQTVTRQGGHMASNLGAVELTIALHTVFDFHKDRLVFDVGHQSYAHKLLTGRAEAFRHLREKGGASGFPRPQESDEDAFAAGHASTAISAALGLAEARDLKGENHAVVALVGDGALTGGMCYEAMNMAGHRKTPLIVILNDNEMSISRNVGALASHLSALRQSVTYRSTRDAVKKGVEAIPLIGMPLSRFAQAIKRAVHSLLIGEEFFESLGFSYYGPVDGHDAEKLIRALRRIQKIRRPVILHVLTRKGQGYPPAEAEPDKYHGVSPQNSPKRPAFSAAACEGLISLAREHAEITALTAAMPGGTGLEPFRKAFPDRFFDVGIAEEHMVTMAAGMAAAGMRPYVCVYSTFLQRGYDQLIHDVCLQNLPVTFLIDRAGLCGADGATHQGVFDLSYLRQMPNMTVAAPRSAAELRAMIRLSFTHPGPMAMRYPKDAPDGEEPLREPIMPGKWEVLRNGDAAALLAVGPNMVRAALDASDALAAQGVSLRVINARFIKPMDLDILHALKGMPVVTLEENALSGGFGSAVKEVFDGHVLCLGVPDRFIPHATIGEQLADCGLDAASVTNSVKNFINGPHNMKNMV